MKKRGAPRRKCCACPEMLHIRKVVCPGCNTNQRTGELEVTMNTIAIMDMVNSDEENSGYDTAESSDADGQRRRSPRRKKAKQAGARRGRPAGRGASGDSTGDSADATDAADADSSASAAGDAAGDSVGDSAADAGDADADSSASAAGDAAGDSVGDSAADAGNAGGDSAGDAAGDIADTWPELKKNVMSIIKDNEMLRKALEKLQKEHDKIRRENSIRYAEECAIQKMREENDKLRERYETDVMNLRARILSMVKEGVKQQKVNEELISDNNRLNETNFRLQFGCSARSNDNDNDNDNDNNNDNDKGTSKKRKRSRKGIEHKENTQPHKPKPSESPDFMDDQEAITLNEQNNHIHNGRGVTWKKRIGRLRHSESTDVLISQGDELFLNSNRIVDSIAKCLSYFWNGKKEIRKIGDLIDGTKGFIGYENVGDDLVGHDSELQAQRTARIQQPRDMRYLFSVIPGLLTTKQAVEALHPELSLMYMDFLLQDFRDGSDGATDFRWHVDTDAYNNTGDAEIVRTVIVKLTDGISKMQIAGLQETTYASCAGSWVDFRSSAYHRSVVVEGTKHYKIVFFLGRRKDVDDGRY